MRRLLLAIGLIAVPQDIEDLTSQFEEKYVELVREAAQAVADQALEEMRFAATNKSFLSLPLAGDSRGIVTEVLASRIAGSGKFKRVERTTWDELREKLGLAEKVRAVTTSKEAIRIASDYGADYVLFGRAAIGARSRRKGKIDLEVRFRIVNVETGKGIFIGTYRTREEAGPLSITRQRMWIQDTSAVGRGIVWLIVMLSIPFVVLLFREVLGGSKPLLPVMLVVGFTGIDLLFAFVLMGFEIDGITKAGLFVVALASALFWNLFVVSKVGQLSGYAAK